MNDAIKKIRAKIREHQEAIQGLKLASKVFLSLGRGPKKVKRKKKVKVG